MRFHDRETQQDLPPKLSRKPTCSRCSTSGNTSPFCIADPGVGPQCLLGSRVWPNEGVNSLYALISANYVEPWLQIYPENWELPAGQKTKVNLGTVAGTLKYQLTARDQSLKPISLVGNEGQSPWL